MLVCMPRTQTPFSPNSTAVLTRQSFDSTPDVFDNVYMRELLAGRTTIPADRWERGGMQLMVYVSMC